MRQTAFLLMLFTALAQCEISGQTCIVWQNGTSYNQQVTNAAEFLCNNGIVDQYQDAASVYNSPAAKKQVAVLVARILFPGAAIPSDFFPSPFVDVNDQTLSAEEESACKAMLYLDYSDGISPFERESYFTHVQLPFSTKGECLRALLEAWNIAPDWNGYNPGSNATSAFYSDVAVNDKYYGWIYKAYQLNLTNNLPLSSCSNNCLANSTPFTLAQVYLLLQNLFNYPSNAQTSNFFLPNNFSITNISNKPGLDRAVFSNYEDPSFSIPGGGFPLSFSHSYHSNLTEIPYKADNYFSLNTQAQLQAMFPIGVGWAHSYNISVVSIKNYVSSTFSEEKLAIRWADGSVDVFDRITNQYLTPGIKDQLNILSTTGQNFTQSLEIVKPDGVRFHFQLEGALGLLHLDTIADRNNNKVLCIYQTGAMVNGYAPQRLFQVKDLVSNRSLTFNYQVNSNFLYSVQDPLGKQILFGVDINTSDLQSFTDAKGQTSYYLYDAGPYKHLLTSVQRPKGNIITNTYQQRRLVANQANAYVVSVNFTPNYLSNSQTSSSQLSVTQGSNTLNVNYQHNTRGNPTHIQSATEDISIVYDAQHPDLPQLVTDNLSGISRQFSYDNNGNITYKAVVSNGLAISETNTYSAFNLVDTHTDPNGNSTHYIYDNQGNVLKIEEPNQVNTFFTYNTNGNTVSKISPVGDTLSYSYNSYGNLSSVSQSGSGAVAYAYYDLDSRITSIKDPKGISVNYAYDSNDNITDEVFDASGLNYASHYTYDANDNLIDITDPRGLHTTLTYDWLTDDLIGETYGAFTKNWAYNTDGTMASYKNKNNVTFNYQYYPVNDNRAGLTLSDGYSTFDYDVVTRLLKEVGRVGAGYKLTYAYDAFQRVNSISYNDLPANTVGYQYDNNGNIISIQYPFNSLWKLDYVWDANNRLIGIRDWNGSYLARYYYRANGQVDYEQLGNGTYTYYIYDAANRLDSLYSVNSQGQIICSFGATLDVSGQHTLESIWVNDGDTVGLVQYPLSIPSSYNYDNTNRLTGTNTGAYSYDNNGNVVADAGSGVNYTWDEKDNLLSLSNGVITKYYEYDPLENRRKYDTTRFVLDVLNKGNVLVETDLAGTPKYLYVHGLGLVCRIEVTTNQRIYYHYDFRGSAVALTNDTQKVIAHYSYEPFGGINKTREPAFNNWFTYVGKYGVMRDENDRYYMRARYYSPTMGRFLSEDPVWSTNLFAYAHNNPVSNIDPDGEQPIPNYGVGKEWENQVINGLKKYFGNNSIQTRYRYTTISSNGVRARADAVLRVFNRNIMYFEAKASDAARYTANQRLVYPTVRNLITIRPSFVRGMQTAATTLGKGLKFAGKILGVAGTIYSLVEPMNGWNPTSPPCESSPYGCY